ncbi:hypothetical protein F0562_019095 [Nyssa sinensis]|uniref:Gnk2-homologous domain-containing protein n=1 Tax=Nyssa sinensis TaxID=561372 RepID=A0A5J4ZDX1_9ASTE|nr:hypothetical protein F0562_019095 [Nyssa sinensis]
MEDILYCKDLYEPIEGDTAKPKDMDDEKWKRLHRKTIGHIRQWLDDSVFSHVSNETDAQVLWKKLEARYEQKTATNKAFLIRKLVNMKFKKGGSITDHLNEFQSVVNQLATMKMVIEDELQALLLLSSLPDSWETLVVTMSNFAPDGKLSMGQVSSSLFNEETRRKLAGTDNAQALVSENRGRSKNRGHKRHEKSKGRSLSRGKSTERAAPSARTCCSQEKFQPNSPFETNLNTFLSSVSTSSSQASYNSFAILNDSSASPEAPIYGLYQCRGDLKTCDCSRCVESAVSQIGLVCPYTYGASLQLDDCMVRYEHVDFRGKLDTSLRYKKCSKSKSNDIEFFRRRDDVLDDLQAAIGFRVSTSGLVEGFAECLGDLSATDCSSCLSDAVGKLKSLCGSAEAADVFSGQCYARYWASGYYDTSSDSSNEEDEVGKTVAIIAGILAALAIVIVLFSFCRKALG